jgi:hypothetical protein
MPTYEDVSIENKSGFDTSDLVFSFTRPIQLCAMELNRIDNNKIIVGSKVKSCPIKRRECKFTNGYNERF